MDEKMLRMVQAAETMQRVLEEKKRKEAEEIEERGHRNIVFQAIMTLQGSPDEDCLLRLLPLMDVQSWEEVAEERFLGGSCALPTCIENVSKDRKLLSSRFKIDPKERAVTPVVRNVQQMFKIDQREGKIFNSSHSARGRFCSRSCWERFEWVKGQLAEEPLWITGKKKDVHYDIFPSSQVGEAEAPLRGPAPGIGIQIVDDRNTVQKMNELFIAERAEEGSSAEEEEDGDQRREETLFASSLLRYCSSGPTGGVKRRAEEDGQKPKEEKNDNGRGGAPLTAKTGNEKKTEDKRLAAIVSRIKTRPRPTPRTAFMTDAVPLSPEQMKHENKSTLVSNVAPGPVSKESIEEESTGMSAEEIAQLPVETIPFSGPWETAASLFLKWLNNRTSALVNAGGRRPMSEVDRRLLAYYAGDKADALNNEPEVELPKVDNVDVKLRRIDILMATLKPRMTALEAFLHVRATKIQEFRSVVSTLELDADSLTGWSKNETHAIVLGLWRIVCLLSDELDNDFFPNGELSVEVRELLERWQFDDGSYRRLGHLIKGRLHMQTTR